MARSTWLALAWTLLAAPIAQAQDSAHVDAIFEGEQAELQSLQASLRELLQRLNVVLETGRPEGALAALEVQWREPLALSLTVKDAKGQVVLVRRLTRTDSSKLLSEAAAHVIQSVVEELLDASRAKPAPPLTPPLLEAAVPRPVVVEAREGLGFGAGAYFGGRLFGGGAPLVVGGGLQLTGSLSRGGFRPFVSLLADYHPPFDRELDLVSLRAQSLSLRVVPGLKVLGGERWRLDAGLGAGADLYFTSTSSAELPQDRLSPARTDGSPVLTALLQVHLAIAERVALEVAFTLDADLHPPRYLAQLGPTREELFSPWRVRPALMLGFSFEAFGPAPYLESSGSSP